MDMLRDFNSEREYRVATTYEQLQKKIEALRAQAEQMKRGELGGVIDRIKEAVAHYGLTASDLFGKRTRAASTSVKSAPRGSKRAVAYSDGQGNTWGGRGPRPRWLREALAEGKQLQDFATKTASGSNGSPAKRRKAGGKKRGGVPRYRDEAGNTWTGVGRKPQWFLDALAAGKKPEEMAVG
jgi:DNA-binding protein H-NS